MVFSSTVFLFCFLPVTLLGYFVLPGLTMKNGWLLCMSLIFFGWSQPHYLWLIIFSIVSNYLFARGIDRFASRKKLLLLLSILVNVGLLYYFKYFTFTLETINAWFHGSMDIVQIILPIGISFFTFQAMSYVIDVYRNDVPVQKNLWKLALYVVLFPQLIAGPIVRYKDVAEEINERSVSLDDFSTGVERFIIGLGKKAIIANTLGSVADQIWSSGLGNITLSIAWLGSLAYTLQIFFDFSGYSDMAIGLGRMFGFHFSENFNLPYISKSITEFWRRWHISLSSWFRDYVYIPLGGNRKHVYLNLAIVFLLTGIWHGAAWNFILWGIWNGFFIVIERLCKKKGIVLIHHDLIRSILGKCYTLAVVHLGWVLFRAPNLAMCVEYLKRMFHVFVPVTPGFSVRWYLTRWVALILVMGILFSSSIPGKVNIYLKAHLPAIIYQAGKYIFLLMLFGLSIVRIVSGTYNPFIYFQF